MDGAWGHVQLRDRCEPPNLNPDCSGATEWTLDDPELQPWIAEPTDTAAFVNGQTGTVAFDVTDDVAAFLDGTENHGWIALPWYEPGFVEVRFHSRETVSKPMLVLAVSVAGGVPAVPPDSEPATLYDDSTMAAAPNGLFFSRSVLSLHFERTATQAQRQAAIDAVGGTVVGGLRFAIDGYYYVRIPAGQTLADIDAAIAELNGLPGVESATRISGPLDVTPWYLKPNDGTGWTAASWTPRTDLSSGVNRNLEMAAFPLAWGCSIGDTLTKIGIIDTKLHTANMADVTPNLDVSNSVGLNMHIGDTHGSWILSILAARGNNGSGITGAMWRAKVMAFEQGLTGDRRPVPGRSGGSGQVPASLPARLRDARTGGARVVNVSLGVPLDLELAHDTATMMLWVRPVLTFLRESQPPDNLATPLIVIAAGNMPTPQSDTLPFWSGFPILADSFPSHVIVVTGHDAQGNVHPTARRGPQVSVAAMGVDAQALESNNSLTTPTLTGTSVAAPLVAGLAGLLFSFDPTLTAPEVRQLIIDGARKDGRTAGGFPMLNAYESLKLAAQRTGAPLCGNRVWANDNSIVAERAGTVTQVLGATSSPLWSLSVHHGGRRIDYFPPGEFRTLTWGPAGWTDSTISSDTSTTTNGASLSRGGLAHDGDSTVRIHQISFDPQTVELRHSRADAFGSPTSPFRPVTTYPGLVANYFGSDPINEAGYSPMYGKAYAPVRAPGSSLGTALSIYETDLLTEQSQVIFAPGSVTGTIHVSVAEDGSEVMVNYLSGGNCNLTFIPRTTYGKPGRTVAVGGTNHFACQQPPGGFGVRTSETTPERAPQGSNRQSRR